MTFLTSMAGTLGCSEEWLRLLLGQLLGYPIIMIYRWIITNQRPSIQHPYFFIAGQAPVLLKINYWNSKVCRSLCWLVCHWGRCELQYLRHSGNLPDPALWRRNSSQCLRLVVSSPWDWSGSHSTCTTGREPGGRGDMFIIHYYTRIPCLRQLLLLGRCGFFKKCFLSLWAHYLLQFKKMS